jgi:hypothetical protein
MKTGILTTFALLLLFNSNAQNIFPSTGSVGIGTTSPNSKSLLEVRSTTKGVLIPRMTQTQRNAITSPPVGLLIFQTNGTSGFYYYTGSAWKAVTPAVGANKTLSNLTTTAINANLTPGASGAVDLGSSAFKWKDAHFKGTVYVDSAASGFGVTATTSYIGVYGGGDSYGIYGYSGGGYGVVGSSGYIGIYGSGGSYGVYGASSSGYGMYANSSSSYGIYASSSTSFGVYGSSGYLGVYGTGTNYGVYGYSANGEGVYGQSNYTAVYALGGTYGVYGQGTSYGLMGSSSSWAGYFFGNVYATGVFQSSDARVKQNIHDFTSAMDIINKLKPKQYQFRTDGDFKSMNFPSGNHFGLIAQDVEKVLPNLVKTSELSAAPDTTTGRNSRPTKKTMIEDFKAVNYTELIPVIIKGMQELNQKIEQLQKENADLKDQVAQLKRITNQSASGASASSLSGALLGQNFPNPFNKNTVISFNIPQQSSSASLVVSQTGTGKIIKSIPVSGASQVAFDAASLSVGAYTYTLYVDGKKIDSKQMVMTK